jgi:hypothetical protein
LSEHDRFEELAHLAAIGELSPEEGEEFRLHKATCLRCRQVAAETSSVAMATFLAASPKDEAADRDSERHRRLREGIAQRLPSDVFIGGLQVQPAPVSFVERNKHLVAAGIAAAFLLGAGIGTAVGYRALPRSVAKTPVAIATPAEVQVPKSPAFANDESVRLQTVVADLQKRMEETRRDNLALRDKLAQSDQHTTALETRLNEVEQQSHKQAQEVIHARNELSTAMVELTQAKDSVNASQATIESLQYKLSDRETRLTEVSASVEREREMLSAGRDVRDVMGARDLHIVDVIDRDGKGRARKAFGRAFYTQGKSLIFYAFDLPTKNTADGKFVYAAWGSNSNNLNSKTAHSLGIFYNDDQTQHRWAMKFDDPKLLEEIDTVFVTLEPAGRPFAKPTGKPLLEAYFGTPPNHP